jgi:hypothetical protein
MGSKRSVARRVQLTGGGSISRTARIISPIWHHGALRGARLPRIGPLDHSDLTPGSRRRGSREQPGGGAKHKRGTSKRHHLRDQSWSTHRAESIGATLALIRCVFAEIQHAKVYSRGGWAPCDLHKSHKGLPHNSSVTHGMPRRVPTCTWVPGEASGSIRRR